MYETNLKISQGDKDWKIGLAFHETAILILLLATNRSSCCKTKQVTTVLKPLRLLAVI